MNTRYFALNVSAFAAAALLAACSGTSQPAVPSAQGAPLPSAQGTPLPGAHGTPLPGGYSHVRNTSHNGLDANPIAPQYRGAASQPRMPAQLLMPNDNGQVVFDSDFDGFSGDGFLESASITSPPGGTLNPFFVQVDNPGGIATALNGDLYVANTNASDILVLREGLFLRSLDDAGERPTDLAITKTGKLYVANIFDMSFGAGNVSVYAPGRAQPTSTLTSPTFFQLIGIAVNDAGTVFVSNNQHRFKNAQVIAFPHGTGTGTVLKNIVMNVAGGLVIDPTTQDLLVLDQGAKFVSVYARPYTGKAKAVYQVPAGGAAVALALDGTSSNLYFADVLRHSVDVISYPAGKFLGSYTGGVQPVGVTVR